MTRRLTADEFAARSTAVHGGKYIYDSVEYKRNSIPVCIRCPVHGDFMQSPCDHMAGKGCFECYYERAGWHINGRAQRFIEKASDIHCNMYDYSLVEYKNAKTKICILCKKHGCFWQTPNGHLSGRGCERCSYEKRGMMCRTPLSVFIDKSKGIHGDQYDYSETLYSGGNGDLSIKCKLHGEFSVKAISHLGGAGCPSCRMPSGERAIESFLIEHGVGYVSQARFPGIGRMRFDFFVPSKQLLIEYDGRQHFFPVESWGGECGLIACRDRDERKNRWAWENNYMLMRIPYWMQDKIPHLLHCQLALSPDVVLL